MNTQEIRNESGNASNFARACAAFMALLVVGYAFTTEVGSATDAAPAVTAPQELAPAAYFPSQYTNQGRSAEEHIQAF